MAIFNKVLLLDGYSTRTLACVRSWGKRGIAFAVGGETRWDMSLFSRYSKETFVYTSPKRNVPAFINDVNKYCRLYQADGVFPTSEAAIMACSSHQDSLCCPAIVPQAHEIQAAFSKANTLAIATSLGLDVPRTVHITPEHRRLVETVDLPFPVVIKSESSEMMLAGRAETSRKTAYVFSRQELLDECGVRLDAGQSILLQEFIDGYGVGVSGLFANGRPVALLAHRRIRESDPCGGPSALAETIELQPRLLNDTSAIMNSIAFNGPAMVEYRIDRKTGRAYLMEINGRFWGTVLLAPAAGLDMPYLYWKMLNGMPIAPEETQYEVGVKGRYLVGDTKCLLLCLKGRPKHWLGEFPERSAAIGSYMRSFFDKRTTDLILTQDDPMPFFARLLHGFI